MAMSPEQYEFVKAIGERVFEARQSKGWSREKLGRETELSHQTIVRIEGASRMANLDTLQKVAHALGVSLAYLLKGEQEDTPNPPKAQRARAA